MKATFAIQSLGDQFLNPVSISLINSNDQHLVYTNKQFQDLVLCKPEDVVGKNCRFLQGEKTDREAVSRIRNAIATKQPICQDLLNYKFNKEIFYNRLVLIPYQEGENSYYLGLQHEIQLEEFKPIHNIGRDELMDRSMNPILILLFLLKHPDADYEKDLLTTMKRIKNFILAL